jgi:hypothetical protein
MGATRTMRAIAMVTLVGMCGIRIMLGAIEASVGANSYEIV